MSAGLVQLHNISKFFYGVKVLENINYTIQPGTIQCLVGENGCGKSTMIKIISGYYDFDGGSITINGQTFKKLMPIDAIKNGIQVIYQDFSLFPNLTVGENIVMSSLVDHRSKFVNPKTIRKMASEAMQRIGFDLNIGQYVSTLNVAQKQMVAICRALQQDAKLIIMDEPTAALTEKEVKKLFDIVFKLKEKGIAIVFVSHKMDEVLKISDWITVIRNGEIVFDGEKAKISKEDLIYNMTGKKLDLNARFIADVKYDKPIMAVQHYTRKRAFEDVGFSLFQGEVLGITGLLGCGRDELAKSLFGLMPADSGHFYLNGRDCGVISSISQALSYEIGFVPEDRLTQGLHLDQSIADNAVVCVIGRLKNRFGLLDSKKIKGTVKDGLSDFNIPNLLPANPVRSLSGGNQQKVALAKWLLTNPKILILDCPTVGVDVGAKSEIHEKIRNLAAGGIGVIVISDDILEIMQVCNRVLIMNAGKIVHEEKIADITMEQLETELTMPYAAKVVTE